MAHCEMIQAGDIQAVVGDASRNGAGGPQYCGLWSLTSKHRVFNAFGNSYAGLIPGEIRGKAPVLEAVDESTIALTRQANDTWPTEARATYKIVAPHYIDHDLTIRDRADRRKAGCSFREVTWCAYTNSPQDPRLHFLSGGEWHRYISPRHGIGSNIAPSYVPNADLEVWPSASDTGGGWSFHWDRYERRFDEPFYYGRLGEMVLIFVFDNPQWLRFYCSPTGGGPSLIPCASCPAWDFEWVIPDASYTVGREYRFRMRLIYKPFISDEDVVQEVRQTQDALGFERVR